MSKVKIEVISDTVCPWCYVGKRRLEAAIRATKGIVAEVHWLPFQLRPDFGTEGVNKLAFYRQAFGAERADKMISDMGRTFAELGMKYNIDGMTGNTSASHRLVGWAAKVGGPSKQNELVEELFRSYFCEAKLISDLDMLAEAAARVGLDKKAARAVLDSDAGQEELQAALASARMGAINGVPHFTIHGRTGDRYKLSGAQPVEIFQKLLVQAAQEGGNGP